MAMQKSEIRFDDGAAYEQMMGTWSRLAGEVFVDWLAPRPSLHWVDVGCGNGAIAELLARRCAPAELHGIDPSPGQLEFARKRAGLETAQFREGNAMALPYNDDVFDSAVMALANFFVPDAAKGVAEMARVVRPGGLVSSYAWDMFGGGFPLEPIGAEPRALGQKPPGPPTAQASKVEALLALWDEAGLQSIETREIEVQRTFTDFEDFWTTSLKSSLGPQVAAMPASDVETLEARVRARLPATPEGAITYGARANAIRGHVATR
jgi:SAM-dependent methyltransferase